MSASDCVFCKIVAGAIPCTRVLETAHVLAFLDVGPLAPGHTLIVPKRHFDSILDIPPEMLCSMLEPFPRLARAVMQAANATGLNLLQNTGRSSGQAVFHLHFHMIPRHEGDGLGYRWNAGKYAPGEAESMQSRLVELLQAAGR